MEKNEKFRLRLNLFDGIVVILAVAVGAFLLWSSRKPQAPAEGAGAAGSSVITYTVRMNRWPQGESSRIQAGDVLADNVKNFELGTVTAVEAVPARTTVLNHEEGRYVLAPIEGYEDIILTLETTGKPVDAGLELDSGYVLRAGNTVYIRGVGYFGSGLITSVEREGQA